MKKLGFGCMRLPLNDKKNNGDIDYTQTAQMFDEFISEGFTYFDTAYMYHDGESERMVKKALVSRHERESFILASKMPVGMLEKPEDTDRIFEDQKEKCGVEYFDYYLLHALNTTYYERALEFGVFDYLADKKEKGQIKRLGFSFHDSADVLERILTEQPQLEFVQLQINYLDWEDERVQSRLCYEIARKHGVDIIVMEPVKGGALANVPKEVETMLKSADSSFSVASWAVRFAASLEGVIMVLSGMSDLTQLRDNMSYMKELVAFTENDYELVKKSAEMIRNALMIDCTSCRYCTDHCPVDMPIPEYFSAYNRKVSGKADFKKHFFSLTDKTTRAEECIECGGCESACPQHIAIIEKLKSMKDLIK